MRRVTWENIHENEASVLSTNRHTTTRQYILAQYSILLRGKTTQSWEFSTSYHYPSMLRRMTMTMIRMPRTTTYLYWPGVNCVVTSSYYVWQLVNDIYQELFAVTTWPLPPPRWSCFDVLFYCAFPLRSGDDRRRWRKHNTTILVSSSTRIMYLIDRILLL